MTVANRKGGTFPDEGARRRPQGVVTRELIIRVTGREIRERGLARVSTRRIADLAGVAEATIFKYFGTKDNLILAALKVRGVGRAAVLDEGVPEGALIEDGFARIAEAVLAYYHRTIAANIAAMADSSILPRHREWLRAETLVSEISGFIERYVAREQSAGQVRPKADGGIVAQLILGAVLRHVLRGLFHGTEESASDDRFVERLSRGMASMIAAEGSGSPTTTQLKKNRKKVRNSGQRRCRWSRGSPAAKRARTGSAPIDGP